MAWIGSLTLLIAVFVGILAINRRLHRYDDEVDSYHERDFRDPPIIGDLDMFR